MEEQKKDFYLEMRERSQSKFFDIIMLGPDFFYLLFRLFVSPEISIKQKAKLATAIVYFVSPLDFVPELLLGPAGYIDDVALAVYVLHDLLNNTDPEIINNLWAGDRGVLRLIQGGLKVASVMLGKGLWEKLKKKLTG